jgi:hypothetical protein
VVLAVILSFIDELHVFGFGIFLVEIHTITPMTEHSPTQGHPTHNTKRKQPERSPPPETQN